MIKNHNPKRSHQHEINDRDNLKKRMWEYRSINDAFTPNPYQSTGNNRKHILDNNANKVDSIPGYNIEIDSENDLDEEHNEYNLKDIEEMLDFERIENEVLDAQSYTIQSDDITNYNQLNIIETNFDTDATPTVLSKKKTILNTEDDTTPLASSKPHELKETAICYSIISSQSDMQNEQKAQQVQETQEVEKAENPYALSSTESIAALKTLETEFIQLIEDGIKFILVFDSIIEGNKKTFSEKAEQLQAKANSLNSKWENVKNGTNSLMTLSSQYLMNGK
ncbi:hypothetical protein AX774_g5874 [Zancudomyces culisetae]|uniref:Uncharacterized protein n=1 Tax=Zancudomyces culisetae TaxID=1213189 RepID=A0A1R1PIC0_ZANCU|nr:hypothetical protein AX774_g5874 [Zancudomyces culisetae]|eukprot:OMH80688.1 hypothetical protein AX774_g5874 [Zancudomyces culisetae]